MFRVTGLKLENICQYDAYDVDFQSGLTAVVGANGGGKTTLLRALAYALTGLVDGGWGTQKALQKDGTATPGFAEARFTDGGHAYTIRRFSTSDIKFADVVTCDGETVALRRKTVDAYMSNVFGMPPALFFQVCWGRQGQLAQLLTSPPALVGAFLSQVWDTKQLEKVREKLKVQIDTIATLSPMCREQLARDEAELAALPSDQEVNDTLADAKKAFAAASDELERLMASLHGAIEPAKKAALVAARSTEVAALEARLAGRQPSIPESAVAGMTSGMVMERYDELREQHSWRDSMLPRLEAEKHDAEHRIQRCTDALADLLAEHNGVEQAMADTLSTGKCAVCGGEIADPVAYRNHLCKTLTTYDTVEEFEANCRTRHDRLMAELEKAKAAVSEKEGAIKEWRAKFEEAEAGMSGMAAMSAAIDYYEQARKLDALRERLKEAEDMPAMDEAAKDELAKAMAAKQSAGDNRDDALGLKQQVAASRRLLESAVENDRKAVAQYEVNSNARDALEQLRDVLSRGRAQQRYLKSRITSLNASLSRFMRLTGMPFSLRLDADELAFVFVTPEGYEHPACHLSGAQQSMSALALQMALFDTIGPNMNLYLIDEPAEALDDENKLVMAEMFARMNRMLPSVDGTMLIVTRDRPIMDACGNVLDVTQGR